MTLNLQLNAIEKSRISNMSLEFGKLIVPSLPERQEQNEL